jgi:hypothetical protein
MVVGLTADNPETRARLYETLPLQVLRADLFVSENITHPLPLKSMVITDRFGAPVEWDVSIQRRPLNFPEKQQAPAQMSESPEVVNEIKQKLHGVWLDVFGLTEIRDSDDFFHLGGHSLLAARAAARIRKIFNVRLTVRDIFQTPTIAKLATVLADRLRNQSPIL